MGIQACSSSGADGAVDTAFSDPVDAASLREALITGKAAGDDTEYWECSVADSSATFEYRLMADGSGVENDRANPTVPSTFTWQTNSASTATTSVQASGMQNELSSITFSDRNNMSLMVAQTLSLACVRQADEGAAPSASPDENEPTASEPTVSASDNEVIYGGNAYALTNGFEKVGANYVPSDRTHAWHQFRVADAPFNSSFDLTGGVSWLPTGASIQFSSNVYSPGGNFESATFNFVPDTIDVQNNPTYTDSYVFQNTNLRIYGDESSSSETLGIVSGTLSVTRLGGDSVAIRFEGTLENGESASVAYEGQFVLYDETF